MNIADQKQAAIEGRIIKTAEIIGEIRKKYGFHWFSRILVRREKMTMHNYIKIVIADTSHMR